MKEFESAFAHDPLTITTYTEDNLRCALLHGGNPNVDNDDLVRRNELPIDHFVLKIESQKEFNIYSDSSQIANIFGQHRRSYTMSIRRICMILCNVAETYYKENREKFHFDYEIVDWDKFASTLPPLDMKEFFKAMADPMLGKGP